MLTIVTDMSIRCEHVASNRTTLTEVSCLKELLFGWILAGIKHSTHNDKTVIEVDMPIQGTLNVGSVI